jgi:hypothetical protein
MSVAVQYMYNQQKNADRLIVENDSSKRTDRVYRVDILNYIRRKAAVGQLQNCGLAGPHSSGRLCCRGIVYYLHQLAIYSADCITRRAQSW